MFPYKLNIFCIFQLDLPKIVRKYSFHVDFYEFVSLIFYAIDSFEEYFIIKKNNTKIRLRVSHSRA